MRQNNIEKKIVIWIKKQLKNAKAKGIVMGLSGGIDSSVVAILSKKAVGKKNLLCLLLPCYSQRQDLQDAKIIAKKFKLRTKIVNLSKVYDNFISILPKADIKTKGNLKARLRMTTLYYFANKLNYLVAGASNKSEFYVGYFTKYGDAGADILPIGDLFKSQVRKLACSLGVPERIINKAPSAGLWRDQTDEDELGISYVELDEILSYIFLGKKKKGTFCNLKKVENIICATEHKRNLPRICYM